MNQKKITQARDKEFLHVEEFGIGRSLCLYWTDVRLPEIIFLERHGSC